MTSLTGQMLPGRTTFKMEILSGFKHLRFKWLATGSLGVSLSMLDMDMSEIVNKGLLRVKRKKNSFHGEES